MAKVVLHFIKNTFYTIDAKSGTILNSTILPNGHDHYHTTGWFIDKQLLNGYQIEAVCLSFHFTFESHKLSYDFYKRLYDLCQSKGCFCYFPSWAFSSRLEAMKKCEDIQINDEVLVIDFDYGLTKGLGVVIRRERDCFKVVFGSDFAISNFGQWKLNMMTRRSIKKVIVQIEKEKIDHPSIVQNVLSALGPNDYAHIVNDLNAFFNKPVLAKVLHVLGEKSNPFDLAFPVRGVYGLYVGDILLKKTTPLECPPLEMSFIVKKYASTSIKLYYDCGFCIGNKDPELIKEIDFNATQVKITFKLDHNSFYELKVESVEDSKLDDLIDYCSVFEKISFAENSPEKFKMIFGKSDFSVQLIHDGKEKVLEDGDGLSKTPIFIAFKEDPPNIGQKARKVFEDAPECVVFDLIKLCSTKSGDIFSSKWAFSVCQKSKDIVVSVKTSTNGQTVQYTVSALLALILKEAGDRVEKVVGKALKKVDVGFDGFKAGEILKKNFEEAGKIAGVDVAFV